MTPEDKKFIRENFGRLSTAQMAARLNLPERKVRKFLAAEKESKGRPAKPSVLPSSVAPRVSFVLVLAVVSILGLAAYSNSFKTTFHYDDLPKIRDNQAIQQFPDLGPIWQNHKTRFLVYLSLALNFGIGKLDVFGYHLFNFLIHLAAALCVFLLARALLQTPQKRADPAAADPDVAAFGASLLFLCHPIQTQAVTYTIQRATSMATLFYLVSILLYLKWRREPKTAVYIGALAAAAAATFCKPIAMTLPLAILLIEAVFFPAADSKKRAALPFAAVALIPAILVAVYGAGEFTGTDDITKQTGVIPRGVYLFTQFNVLMTYLRLLVFPVRQSIVYDYPLAHGLFEGRTALSVLGLSALIAASVFLIKRKRVLAAFGLWFFLLALLPESSFYPLQDVIFEHRLYLPSAGFFLAVSSLVGSIKLNRKVLFAAIGVLAVVLAVVTFQRNRVWKDDKTLWEDVMRKAPRNSTGFMNLGRYYHDRNELDTAVLYYDKALAVAEKSEIKTTYTTLVNLAIIHSQRGDNQKAIDLLLRALEAGPNSAPVHYNLGMAYHRTGQLEKEMQCFRRAIELDPGHVLAHNNLGAALVNQGKVDEAIPH